jgi:hypothetical protein
MKDFVDGTAFNNEQGNRARKLFAAVVLAALDDAIADDKKYGNGPEQIARWARSRDGREVLSCAGIDPNERVVSGLMDCISFTTSNTMEKQSLQGCFFDSTTEIFRYFSDYCWNALKSALKAEAWIN